MTSSFNSLCIFYITIRKIPIGKKRIRITTFQLKKKKKIRLTILTAAYSEAVYKSEGKDGFLALQSPCL